MLRTILIDDEDNALASMERDLQTYCFDKVDIIEKCNSPIKGLMAIRSQEPELVILDIQYKGHEIDNSFDLLKILGDINFEVIFVSAHDKYAIKAFELNAVHYLTKPVKKEELIKAVDRVVEKQKKLIDQDILEKVIDNLTQNQTIENLNICIPTIRKEYINFPFSKIAYCISDGNLSQVFLIDKKKITANYSLGKLTDLLAGPFFFRIHKQYLVCKNQIQKYNQAEEYVLMHDGQKLNIAKRKKKDFEKWFGILSPSN